MSCSANVLFLVLSAITPIVTGYAGALGEAMQRHKLTKGSFEREIVIHVIGATDDAEATVRWGPQVCFAGVTLVAVGPQITESSQPSAPQPCKIRHLRALYHGESLAEAVTRGKLGFREVGQTTPTPTPTPTPNINRGLKHREV